MKIPSPTREGSRKTHAMKDSRCLRRGPGHVGPLVDVPPWWTQWSER